MTSDCSGDRRIATCVNVCGGCLVVPALMIKPPRSIAQSTGQMTFRGSTYSAPWLGGIDGASACRAVMV